MSKLNWGGGGGGFAPTMPKRQVSTPGQINAPVQQGQTWEGGNIPLTPQSAFPVDGGGEGLGGHPFPFPEQWQQASNIYSQLAQGGGFNNPQAWQMGMNALGPMLQGGMPVDVAGLGEHYQNVGSTMMEDFTKQAAEQAGLGGLRWSTPLTYQISEQGRRLGENFGLSMAQQAIQAQEAARNRMMGGIGQAFNYGQGNLGMQGMAAQQQMQGLQGLTNMGSNYMYAPMNISQGLVGLGNQMQGQAMNPYAQMAMVMGGQSGQYVPQQYNPSFASQAFNVAGAALPYFLNQSAGGGITASAGGGAGAGGSANVSLR